MALVQWCSGFVSSLRYPGVHHRAGAGAIPDRLPIASSGNFMYRPTSLVGFLPLGPLERLGAS